jgi:hypothetical protein
MACCERLFGLIKHRIPLEISQCALPSRVTCVTGNTMIYCERLFLSSFLETCTKLSVQSSPLISILSFQIAFLFIFFANFSFTSFYIYFLI